MYILFLVVGGEDETKSRSNPGIAFHPQSPTMRLDEHLDECHISPGTTQAGWLAPWPAPIKDLVKRLTYPREGMLPKPPTAIARGACQRA